jgi:hypothetical protein
MKIPRGENNAVNTIVASGQAHATTTTTKKMKEKKLLKHERNGTEKNTNEHCGT